jgi:superfamily I DNA/RNA helicase
MDHNNKTAIIGLPGTGKTTTLVNMIPEIIVKEDFQLEDICFCTFSKDMAAEIRTKSMDLLGISEKDLKGLPYFGKTIHSVCLRLTQNGFKGVGKEDKEDFAKKYNLKYDSENEHAKDLLNVFFNARSYLINENFSVEDYRKYKPIAKSTVTLERFIELCKLWKAYKEEKRLVDFEDMLKKVDRSGLIPPTRVLIVDEFQDLNPLQYEIYKRWAENMDKVVIVGDPFQAIYSFMGSKPEFFRVESGNNLSVLPITYRLNKSSWLFARKIIEKNKVPIPDLECKGESEHGPCFVGRITPNLDRKREIAILGQCGFMLANVVKELDNAGIPHKGFGGWSDKEVLLFNAFFKLRNKRDDFFREEVDWLIEVFRSGFLGGKKKELKKLIKPRMCFSEVSRFISPFFIEDILLEPYSREYVLSSKNALPDSSLKRIMKGFKVYKEPIDLKNAVYVGTIHSAKGSQFDDVFLLGNISNSTVKENQRDHEKMMETNRLFFVGATRHSHRLFLVRDYLRNGKVFKFPDLN